MSTEVKQYFKNNIFSFSTLVVILVFVANQSRWIEKVDLHIENFKIHKSDAVKHMPFQDKITIFVPRTELERRLENIEKTLFEIKMDIK
jgi:hypothetical protein